MKELTELTELTGRLLKTRAKAVTVCDILFFVFKIGEYLIKIMKLLCYSNDWIGPPHNANWSIADVQVNATSGQCLGDWVCEHRWPLIKAMVKFRSVAGDSALTNWWDDGGRLIAFSRADRAFIAINDDPVKTMDVVLQTGLPTGFYCDVASGTLNEDGSECTGRTVTGTIKPCPDDSALYKFTFIIIIIIIIIIVHTGDYSRRSKTIVAGNGDDNLSLGTATERRL